VGVWERSGRPLEHGPSGSVIPQPVEQRLCGPMGQGLTCSAGCSFNLSWHGEAFHELGVQSADFSAFPGALLSAKCVSSVSAKFLVHGAHAVCGCVPVAMLALSVPSLSISWKS
jgi:hypothetical protein